MIKRLVGVFLIISFISFLGFYSDYKIRNFEHSFVPLLNSACENAMENDIKKTTAYTKQAYTQWNKNKNVLAFFVKRDRLDELDSFMIELLPFLENGDIANFCASAQTASELAQTIYEESKPSFSTIF